MGEEGEDGEDNEDEEAIAETFRVYSPALWCSRRGSVLFAMKMRFRGDMRYH